MAVVRGGGKESSDICSAFSFCALSKKNSQVVSAERRSGTGLQRGLGVVLRWKVGSGHG